MTRQEIDNKIIVAYDDMDGRVYEYEFDGGHIMHDRLLTRLIETVYSIISTESEE